MTRTISEKRAIFRALHDQGCFVLPNPWDIGSSRFLQGLGFKALATTSAGFSWSAGQSDGKVPLESVLSHLKAMVDASDLPLNADFENGFAPDADGVATNVALAVKTGVAGLSIEDASGDPAHPVFPVDIAVARLRAARQAIDDAGGEVFLVGRAENFITGNPDLEDTIVRLKAYSEAGADCLFAPGLRTREQISAVVAAVAPKPVNLLVGAPLGLTVQQISELGVRRVSVGGALARAAWDGFMRAAHALAERDDFEEFANLVATPQLNAFFRISNEEPLLKQPARIVGSVGYRQGEGSLLEIPRGAVEVETTAADAVITWPEGKFHGVAAMPVANFCQYVADGAITVAVKPALPI